MTEAKEWVVQWLRDAHAVEEQAETMMNGLLSRIENYPVLAERIQQHVEETKRQASRLDQCLKILGEDSSALKDAGGKMMAMAQSLSGVFAGDEILKGSLASYSFENMEIASYRILISAATFLGESDIARLCEESLREEQQMAKWLEDHLDETTQMFLNRSLHEGVSEKR